MAKGPNQPLASSNSLAGCGAAICVVMAVWVLKYPSPGPPSDKHPPDCAAAAINPGPSGDQIAKALKQIQYCGFVQLSESVDSAEVGLAQFDHSHKHANLSATFQPPASPPPLAGSLWTSAVWWLRFFVACVNTCASRPLRNCGYPFGTHRHNRPPRVNTGLGRSTPTRVPAISGDKVS